MLDSALVLELTVYTDKRRRGASVMSPGLRSWVRLGIWWNGGVLTALLNLFANNRWRWTTCRMLEPARVHGLMIWGAFILPWRFRVSWVIWFYNRMLATA